MGTDATNGAEPGVVPAVGGRRRPARHCGVALPTPLLAHATGFSWDESLLVVTPLVVIGGLLWLANRRAARLGGPAGPGDATDDTAPPGGPETPDRPAAGARDEGTG